MREMSLDEVKNCTLDILKWLKDFCAEHNITWWLCGGTLLGAARHKGFIPWDDDIDIMLPRKEYERLFAEFPKDSRYQFLTIDNTPGFPYPFGKIVDTHTLKDEPIRKKFKRTGVDIDVFPIDNLPSDYKECEDYYGEIAKVGLKLSGMTLVYGKGKTLLCTILKNGYILYHRILEGLRIISYEKTQEQFIELAQRYNEQDCDYCGITCINHYGIKERNLKKGYEKTIEVEFEGHTFPAPECYSTYLSQLYGDDYMQLPPEDKRVSHHVYNVWWKDY